MKLMELMKRKKQKEETPLLQCEACGIKATRRSLHAHHDDYARPDVTRLLCPHCHSAWHKENGKANNHHLAAHYFDPKDHLQVDDGQRYINSKQTAARLGISPATLHRWRNDGYGPPHIQVQKGGAVRYLVQDVMEWEDRLRNEQP